MIRFDEVPIGRRFNSSVFKEELKRKVSTKSFVMDRSPEILEVLYHDPDIMVELVDICLNCIHIRDGLGFSSGKSCSRSGRIIGGVDYKMGDAGGIVSDNQGLSVDRFWCSEGELK